MASRFFFLSAGLLIVCLVVRAEKDTDYYYPGFENPNAKNKMYWKDSVNVLQDLDQFDSLYIKYHRCVWSKYGSRYGSGKDYDEQDIDDYQQDRSDSACGSWGGEYFWYMGRTQCFKAQVAYSLYGVLKGSRTWKKKGSAVCSKHTYINSFFTTFGVESFAGPLGLQVDNVNSECKSEEGGEEANYDDAAADDDYLDDAYQYNNYASYTSVGIGCSRHGTFVQDQFSGAFCQSANYQETLDTLPSFNSAMDSQECTQIYDSSYGYGGYRKLNEEDYEFQDMEAVRILSFSKSCSLRQYPDDCPDPYGIKKKYSIKIDNAFLYKTGSLRNVKVTILKTLSYLSLIGGVLAILASLLTLRKAWRRQRKRKMTRGRRERRRARSSSKSRSRSRTTTRSRSESNQRSSSRKSRIGYSGAYMSEGESYDNNISGRVSNARDSVRTRSSSKPKRIFGRRLFRK